MINDCYISLVVESMYTLAFDYFITHCVSSKFVTLHDALFTLFKAWL